MTTNNKFIEWTSDIDHALSSGTINIKFEKNDHSIRTMVATLVDQNIPDQFKPNGRGKVTSANVRRVFDVENNGWRSINKDRVIEWSLM